MKLFTLEEPSEVADEERQEIVDALTDVVKINRPKIECRLMGPVEWVVM